MPYYYVSYAKVHHSYRISRERLEKYRETGKTLDPRDLDGPARHTDFHIKLLKDTHPFEWALDKHNVALLNFWELDEATYTQLKEGPKNSHES